MYSKRTRGVTAFDYKARRRRRRIILAIAVLVAGGVVTSVVFPVSSKPKSGIRSQRRELLRFWENGSYEEVFKRCRAALDSRPMDYFLLTMYGFSSYQLGVSQINNLEAALFFDECVLSLRKAMLMKDAAKDGRLYYVLGKAYWYKGEDFADLSVTYLEKSRELSYSAADIPEFLGMAYASIGDYRSSVAVFAEALNPPVQKTEARGAAGREDPGSSGPLLFYIARSYLALDEYETAGAYLHRCIEASPDSNVVFQARLLLADALKSAGDTEGAVKQLMEVLEESGDNAEVHYRLGELYALQGETARARAEWRLAIRADPAHAKARMRLSL